MSQSSDDSGKLYEGKPTESDPCNVGSYAHLSANHVVNIAVDQIRLAGVPAHLLSQELIRSTAGVIWNVVTTVQEQMIGHRNLQAATSRNLLYSLDRLLRLSPMPLVRHDLGRMANAQELTAWGVETVARLSALEAISIDLAQRGANLGAVHDFQGVPLAAPGGPGGAGGAPGAATTSTTRSPSAWGGHGAPQGASLTPQFMPPQASPVSADDFLQQTYDAAFDA